MSSVASLATVVVYAYSSFVSSWGPGPAIAKKFEKHCHCYVKFVDAGNGGDMISRIKLEQKDFSGDVVVGIDENFLESFKTDLRWSSPFTAFEKGPFAFIYNSEIVKDPPHSLDDLLDPKWKGQIIIEDPRLSTVGLGFLLWVLRERDAASWDYLARFKSQIRVVAPSWDMAYGLFKKKQGLLVFSYWSSPAYHIQEEKTDIYKAAVFNDGHYGQTEYLTVSPNAKNRHLAESFAKFMLSTAAQEEIMQKNFMYAVNLKAPLTPAFKRLGKAKTLEPLAPREVATHLNTWLKRWRETL